MIAEGSVNPSQDAQAGTQDSDRDPDLAAGWPRQELTKRDEIGVCMLANPFPPADVFFTEVAEVRDWPAERSEA
jgi:hypothetical protein